MIFFKRLFLLWRHDLSCSVIWLGWSIFLPKAAHIMFYKLCQVSARSAQQWLGCHVGTTNGGGGGGRGGGVNLPPPLARINLQGVSLEMLFSRKIGKNRKKITENYENLCCYAKHRNTFGFCPDLFSLQMVCTHKVLKIKGGIAAISERSSSIFSP